MAKKEEEARIRVARLLSGDVRVDDLSRLLRSVRFRTRGRETVRDIADLTAHEEDRTKGLVFDRVSDTYFMFRMRVETAKGPLDFRQLPGFSREAVRGALNRCPETLIMVRTGHHRQSAIQLFESSKKAFRKNGDGTLDASACTPEQLALMNHMLGHMVIAPAFGEQEIYDDLVAVLLENRLLEKGEANRLKPIKPKLALFLLSLLHRVDLMLPDGQVAGVEMRCRPAGDRWFLGASASFPSVSNPMIRIAFDIFNTTLDAAEYCHASWIALAKHANGDKAAEGSWDSPVELSADWKLHPLR